MNSQAAKIHPQAGPRPTTAPRRSPIMPARAELESALPQARSSAAAASSATSQLKLSMRRAKRNGDGRQRYIAASTAEIIAELDG